MNIDSLKIIRAVLLRTFAVSVILSIIMTLATILLWNTWTQITASIFHVDPNSLGTLMVNFVANCKLIFIFLMLAPALGIHWTIKKMEKQST